MTKFNKTRWSEKDFAHGYLESADIHIVERGKLLEILKSFYQHFLGNKQQKSVLDLGCGDGIIVHGLLKVDQRLAATLIDASEDMLNKAKERLADYKNIHFVKASFQEILDKNIELPNFDLVVSAFAIHHLTMKEKKSLFNYIHSHLNNGGHFVNIDVILSPTEDLEKWYLKLWKKWIIERQEALELKGNYADIIRRYKENPDNKPDTLTNQLNFLRVIGYKDVDCFYKQGVFAMYGGRK